MFLSHGIFILVWLTTTTKAAWFDRNTLSALVDEVDHTVAACQEDSLTLQCRNRYNKIIIKGVFYGRDNYFTCTSKIFKADKLCSEPTPQNVVDKVHLMCNGENKCKVPVTSQFLEKDGAEICPGIRKYLKVTYACHQNPHLHMVCHDGCSSTCWPMCAASCCHPAPVHVAAPAHEAKAEKESKPVKEQMPLSKPETEKIVTVHHLGSITLNQQQLQCGAGCPGSCAPLCQPTCCQTQMPSISIAPMTASACPGDCSGACLPLCDPTCCASKKKEKSKFETPLALTCPGQCSSACAPSCDMQCCSLHNQCPGTCSSKCAPACKTECCYHQSMMIYPPPPPPPPPACPFPCAAQCAPLCTPTCCQSAPPQVQAPPPIMMPPPPPPPTCPQGCPASCAPMCQPTCCGGMMPPAMPMLPPAQPMMPMMSPYMQAPMMSMPFQSPMMAGGECSPMCTQQMCEPACPPQCCDASDAGQGASSQGVTEDEFSARKTYQEMLKKFREKQLKRYFQGK